MNSSGAIKFVEQEQAGLSKVDYQIEPSLLPFRFQVFQFCLIHHSELLRQLKWSRKFRTK
jgi:hypothetical protein